MASLRAVALAFLLAASVAAQAQDQPAAPAPRARPAPAIVWAPKPDAAPYLPPNRPHLVLANLVKQHAGEKNWAETIVRDAGGLTGRYIQMAPGEKTKTSFYADSSMFWIVQAGQMRVTIQGQAPFTAAPGFIVQVPARLSFQMETFGDMPCLRFEVTHTRSKVFYPADETPAPLPGVTYQKVTLTGGPGSYGTARPYLDFRKEVVEGGARVGTGFVKDGETAVNITRAPGVPRPPDSDPGHFHDGSSEFWFVMEGEVDFLIEGEPYIRGLPGDIVYAPAGRWHRSGHVGTGMDTRISIHPIGNAVNALPPP